MSDLILLDNRVAGLEVGGTALPPAADIRTLPDGASFVLAPAPAETPQTEEETAPQPAVRRRAARGWAQWYDIGVVLLMLASGGVAVWRLLWMGQ